MSQLPQLLFKCIHIVYCIDLQFITISHNSYLKKKKNYICVKMNCAI